MAAIQARSATWLAVLLGTLLPMTASEPLRIIALGDSITDGNTWPQIVMQALRDTPGGTPVIICAGAGGDTTQRMHERLPALLAQLTPKVVLLQGGTNDAMCGVPVATWLAAVCDIVTTCRTAQVEVLVGTPCTISDNHSTAEQRVAFAEPQRLRAAYATALGELAKELHVPLAETGACMTAAEATGIVMAGDGIHPAYHGQAAMARAWLDVLGHRNITLPVAFAPRPYPGLITTWQVRAAEDPSDPWRTLMVPEPAPAIPVSAEDWPEQMRQNGFCNALGAAYAPRAVRAHTTITLPTAMWLHLGGGALSEVRLNDAVIYTRSDWQGYHLGAIRIPLAAAPGAHQLEIICTGSFAASLTTGVAWEDGWR